MSSDNKTIANDGNVDDFINAVENIKRHTDALWLIGLFSRISGVKPVMWGPSIVGFGSYHYVYDSGREGDMPRVGFSPRKSSLVLYLALDFEGADQMLDILGKHRLSKACMYINKLDDVDLDCLEEIVQKSWQSMGERFPI